MLGIVANADFICNPAPLAAALTRTACVLDGVSRIGACSLAGTDEGAGASS